MHGDYEDSTKPPSLNPGHAEETASPEQSDEWKPQGQDNSLDPVYAQRVEKLR